VFTLLLFYILSVVLECQLEYGFKLSNMQNIANNRLQQNRNTLCLEKNTDLTLYYKMSKLNKLSYA